MLVRNQYPEKVSTIKKKKKNRLENRRLKRMGDKRNIGKSLNFVSDLD